MRQAGYVAVWGKGVWWGDLRQRDHLEDPGIDRGITLTRIFKKCCGGMDWIDLAQDRGFCKCGNELSGSIKHVEFLD